LHPSIEFGLLRGAAEELANLYAQRIFSGPRFVRHFELTDAIKLRASGHIVRKFPAIVSPDCYASANAASLHGSRL